MKDVVGQGGALLWWGIGLAMVYIAFIPAANYVAQRRLFRPQPASYSDQDPGIIKLRCSDGLKIAALYLPNPTARYTLLFSHGNMADVGLSVPLANQLHAQGFSVLVYDYPGYGTSEGTPNELGVYRAIDAAYQFLTVEQHIPAERIIAYGRSLGGGPTCDLAVRKPLAGVTLECTFASVFRIKTRYRLLPFDKFKNLKKAPHFTAPVLVIHGKLDEVVPFWHGQALYNAICTKKSHLWLDNAGHSDIEEVAHHKFWLAIHQFCEGLQSP